MEPGLTKISVGAATLTGNLMIPEGAKGVVVFAHGSGSSRHSPRNQFVAEQLRESSIATLLIDLLTEAEEKVDDATRELRFDIGLLAKRLAAITSWLKKNPETRELKVGYFGASTGAAAALVAAAQNPQVAAVVSRGGRPDLAGVSLAKVIAPTLLIVGGDDFGVIELNQQAYDLLRGTKELAIVPGATHLFEEEGALEEVARMAQKWFQRYLSL